MYLKGRKNRFELAGFRVLGVKITVNIYEVNPSEIGFASSYRELFYVIFRTTQISTQVFYGGFYVARYFYFAYNKPKTFIDVKKSSFPI